MTYYNPWMLEETAKYNTEYMQSEAENYRLIRDVLEAKKPKIPEKRSVSLRSGRLAYVVAIVVLVALMVVQVVVAAINSPAGGGGGGLLHWAP